uniref:LETM1 and EF-hand domain-containing protein 1, mitochondrial n=1 Tax=Aceria tosichella TaxID=561515 RepID=A0A6G1SDS0_9ACAR
MSSLILRPLIYRVTMHTRHHQFGPLLVLRPRYMSTLPDNNNNNNNKIKPPEKVKLTKRVMDELKHYYHGFRLLFIDLRISSRYVKKMALGEQLSRREHEQLVRSVSDLFRLVPFSIFIIVPFMEFLLPVFVKFFPSLLPSTFQTKKDKDARIKNQLRIKLDTAKFLQETLDDLAFQAKGSSHSEEAKKFAKFFQEVRTSGVGASNADILKYSKLFEDEITLDSMTRQQLVACCKLLELQPLGTNAFLRFQLRTRLNALKSDDEMILKEGITSLTVSELQAACRARGMRALGVPIERLQEQLAQWLELSLNEKIPPSLLLLSRALFVPENIPTSEQLKVTIQSLPELAGTEVQYNIGELEGRVDNKTKLEFIKREEEEIKREELQEEVESFKSNYDEALIVKAEEIIERAAKLNQTTILKIVKQKSEKNDLTMEFLEAIERDLDPTDETNFEEKLANIRVKFKEAYKEAHPK